ncbi:MAG: sigma-70 family RNA polymerase sigma factor [Victivallales bacterium]
MDETVKKEDSELIRSFNSGSESAFDELVMRYSTQMFKLAYGFLRSHEDAEEVVQDTFVKVYKNLKTFRGDSSFSTWLYRILINLARNKYHWNKRRGEQQKTSISEKRQSLDGGDAGDMDFADTSQSTPHAMTERNEEEERIMTAIARLPETLREAIALRHLEDMRYEDIARVTGANIGTVKSRLSRARKALTKELKNEKSNQ